MSLSRPARFPLLKLPWLCIKCVLHNSDLVDIIFFVSLSNRTRRIVKSSNYPLKEMEVSLSRDRKIRIGDTLEDPKNEKTLHFMHSKYAFGIPLGKAPCFLNRYLDSSKDHYLESYTARDTLDALKTVMSILIDVFGCTVIHVIVDGDKLSYWKILKLLIKFLCQLDLPELYFLHHRFSVEDVVSYITYWFNSENRKLEYLYVNFKNPVSLGDFKIEHLNPMPFCEKRRNKCLFVNGWAKIDMTSGKDILRQDGLLATFYINFTSVIFHVWHKRFPDAVQQ